MLQRVDLPVRDIVRVLLSGALGAFVLVWTSYLFTGRDLLASAPAASVLGIAGIIGFATSMLDLHTILPPWRQEWANALERIRRELHAITEQSAYAEERWGKPMYKIWLDAMCNANVRAHLHYVTGLFYMSVVAFAILAVGAVVSVSPFIRSIHVLLELDGNQLTSLTWARVATFPVEILLCIAFVIRGMGYMRDAEKEGVLAMHLSESKEQLRALTAAAEESGALELHPGVISDFVRASVATVRPLEAGRIRNVSSPTRVEAMSLRDGSALRCANLIVYAEDCAAASVINGRPNLYNGESQRQIEAGLTESLAPRLGVRKIRLEVAPHNCSLDACDFGPRVSKEVDRLSLTEARALGVVKPSSPIVQLCADAGVTELLLRNGAIIGPNPALYAALREILPRLARGAKIYDPFAGTFLTERVTQGRDQLEAVCSDIACPDPSRCRDAFTDQPADHFALVVIDPLYEDVLSYVREKLPELSWEKALVVSGEAGDVHWNAAVRSVLERSAALLPLESERYGKSLFLVERQA